MKCIYLLCIFFLISFIFVRCSNAEIEKKMEEMMYKKVEIPVDRMCVLYRDAPAIMRDSMYLKDRMKWIIYLDSSYCKPCQISSIYDWEAFMTNNNLSSDSISFMFIFSITKESLSDFQNAYKKACISHEAFVDTALLFAKRNPFIPKEAMFHTFLLDKNNEIVLVGNPIKNQMIKDLFLKQRKKLEE